MAAHWAAESLTEGQSQLAVRFEFGDGRLPPGAIERCVGNFGALPGVTLLEAWRNGALVAGTLNDGSGTTALLEVRAEGAAGARGAASVCLAVESRGLVGEAATLWHTLTPLVEAVERVLADFEGCLYERHVKEGLLPHA